MDLRRPDVLTLEVRDLERSLAFFHGVLGLPVKVRTDGYAELQTETVLLVLVANRDRPPPGASPALGWEVEDVTAEAARLVALGVTVEPAREVPGVPAAGLRRAFRDPDGHVFELVAYPTE